MSKNRVQQVKNPFGSGPPAAVSGIKVKDPFGAKPSAINAQQTVVASGRNKRQSIKNSPLPSWPSGNQTPSDWVTVKSNAVGPQTSKPQYTYTTTKAPRKFTLTGDEPNALRHTQPKPDPSATVCAICNGAFQNSSIMVDGYKLHQNCFGCAKCGKNMDHKQPNSFVKLNGITLHFREKYICSSCKQQNKYGAYGNCSECGKGLPSVYFEDSDGHKYHNECFNCNSCGISLLEARFMSNTGKERLCASCQQSRAWPTKPINPYADK